MESGEPGVTVGAGVGPEPRVHIVVDPPLDACFELPWAVFALELLGPVRPHDVIVQLQLGLPTVGADLASVCQTEPVHSVHVRLQVALARK